MDGGFENPMLAAALEYAARGWYVCPLRAGTKADHLTGAGGYHNASRDPEQVRRWWTQWPDANIALNLEASGLVALDPDTYKESCGWHNYINGREIPVTLVQRSARGGLHLIFKADPGAEYPGTLCPEVEIKHRGYIMLEPSTFEGGTYRFETDDEPAPCPEWVPRKVKAEEPPKNCGSATEDERNSILERLNSTSNLLAREDWIKLCFALKVALGDQGREAWLAFSARFPGAKKAGEAERVWDTAKPDGTATIGSIFYLLRAPEQAPPASIRPTPYTWRDPSTIPPRQWLFGKHLIRQFLSLTVAPGALGKSSMITVEILSMLTGKPLMGDAPPFPLRVWSWNGEDPRDELDRRFQAACLHYGIREEDIGGRYMTDSGRDLPITIASTGKDGCKIATPQVEGITRALIENKIDVLIVDPFITSHSVPENDTTAINAVVAEWRKIADRANCAIELVHHVSKAAAMDDSFGIYGARGAGALIDGVRSARFLARMSKEEGERFGVENPRRFFRVEGGKENLTPPQNATWRQMIGVSLGNGSGFWIEGDDVGVCTAWEPPDVFDGVTTRDLQRVQRAVDACDNPPKAKELASDWVGFVVAEVLELDLGRGLKKAERTSAQNQARAKVRRLLSEWIKSGALAVESQHDGRTGRDVEVINVGDPVTEADIRGVDA